MSAKNISEISHYFRLDLCIGFSQQKQCLPTRNNILNDRDLRYVIDIKWTNEQF